VATYLERDLRSQLQVSSLHDFERFVRAVALRSAQLLNRSELARDVGVSGSTAGVWLSLLERGGLMAWLLGIGSEEDLLRSPLLGAVWETQVVGELRRLLAAGGDPARLHFWRDRSREVDVVLPRAAPLPAWGGGGGAGRGLGAGGGGSLRSEAAPPRMRL
jgi:hypothetical protein